MAATVPTLPWAATRFEVTKAGIRPGATCNRPVPIYRGHLRGWQDCIGLMARRNGKVTCARCGRGQT